jgi:hypothetical protein
VSDSVTTTRVQGRVDDGFAPPVRIVEVTLDGTWRVRLPGSRRASAVLDTRGDAEARAREILRRSGGGELRISLTNGEIVRQTVAAESPVPGRRQFTRQPRGSRC